MECVIVESDWPEYEPTWKAIEARVTGAQPSLSFADAYQGAMEDGETWSTVFMGDTVIDSEPTMKLLS